jgi:predicted DNA-binding transcriptional regulator YafY
VNRIDRLYALAEELRAVAPRARTARQLAARFELSTRTIERDLLALQEAGVPIWATPGPGGGYTVDPAMSLPPVNFTADEATAVAVALATGSHAPFADAARSALVKLAAALTAPEREAAEDLASRVKLLGARRDQRGNAIAGALAAAVSNRQVVVLEYIDRNDESTTRAVEAHGLAVSDDGVWYLLAWCRLRDDERVFRVDRIRAVRPTTERAAARELVGGPPRSARLALWE